MLYHSSRVQWMFIKLEKKIKINSWKIIILSQQSTSHPLVFVLEMSLHDGKVHISTGLYWGLLVSYIGAYSTFFSGLAWFLIVGYHTHETFNLIVNSICKTFYQRVISSSIDNIIEELASYGFNNSISTVGSFGISCLKHCFPPVMGTSEGASIRCEMDRTQIPSVNVYPSIQQECGMRSDAAESPKISILEKFGHRSQLSIESRKARLLAEQNQSRQGSIGNVMGLPANLSGSETLIELERRLRFQESVGISSPKKAPAIRMPLISENLN